MTVHRYAVVLDGPAAEFIAALTRPELARWKSAGAVLPAALARLIEDIEAAAAAAREERLGVAVAVPDGTCGIPQRGACENVPTMTTDAAADQLGCTPRNVRALADRGALLGHREGRAWRVDAGSVAALVARRAAGE